MNVEWRASPNFSKTRKKITTIVIHWFGSGTLASADSRFKNPASGVSAHYGISGGKVYQWVKDEHTAFHSGVFDVNLQSIGIEHDAVVGREATEETYRTSAELIKQICAKHGLTPSKSVLKPHNAFKATQCPGTMSIDRILSYINQGESMKLRDQLSPDGLRYAKEITFMLEKSDGVDLKDYFETTHENVKLGDSDINRFLKYLRYHQGHLAVYNELIRLRKEAQQGDTVSKKKLEEIKKLNDLITQILKG